MVFKISSTDHEVPQQNLGYGTILQTERRECSRSGTDASFAPGGGLPHGSVVAGMGSTPVMWRSSKQPFLFVHGRDRKLVEAIEGVIVEIP